MLHHRKEGTARSIFLLRRIIGKQLLDVIRQLVRNLSRVTLVIAINTTPDQVAAFRIHEVDDQRPLGESERFDSSAPAPASSWKTFHLSFIRSAEPEVHNEVGPILYFRHALGLKLRTY